MRSKSLILIAFLLTLYIAPMIFISSYGGVVIPAEPNMSKDFSLSGYGDESPQSIPSFAETLSDDVMFFPDGDFARDPTLASAGSVTGTDGTGDYTDTHTVGDDYYYYYDTADPEAVTITLNFTTPSDVNIGKIEVNVYAHCRSFDGAVDTKDVVIYDGAAWDDFGNLVEDNSAPYDDGFGWVNFTTSADSGYWTSDSKVTVKFDVADDADVFLYVDYAEVVFYYPHLNDADHYAESFFVVSDWETPATGVTGATITSDDDVATITENGPANLGIAYAEFDETDYYEYYYEFSIVSMTATTAGLMFWDDTVLLNYNLLKTFTAAGTYKGIISNTDADSMVRIGFVIDSNNGDIKPDYLRISPANESGWQHDGSTTAGVTNDGDGDKTYSASSDGDIITLNITTDVGASGSANYYFGFDTTTTVTDLERDYYPFVEVKVRLIGNTGGGVGLYIAADGYRSVIDSNFIETDWITYRINHKSSTTVDANKRFYLYWNGGDAKTIEMELDFVKVYSIANFTVTQSGVTKDDYLYADSGTLYSHIDTGHIEANYDPALDLGHYRWNMDTSLGTPEVDFYNGAWLGYSSETTGEFSPSTTVTDFRLKFTDNANIMSLKFTDLVGWQDAGTVIIFFVVPVFTGSLDALLIFLGLILIPASTLYFVKGGKEEMSSNKVYYCLIAFCIGWALFLGGIYG